MILFACFFLYIFERDLLTVYYYREDLIMRVDFIRVKTLSL